MELRGGLFHWYSRVHLLVYRRSQILADPKWVTLFRRLAEKELSAALVLHPSRLPALLPFHVSALLLS